MFHSLFWRRLGMVVSCVLLLTVMFPFPKTLAAGSTAQWVTVGSMTTPRIVLGAALLQDGRVLVTAGTNTNFLSTSELYDPRTRTWSPTGNINQVRLLWVSPGMVTLPNGKVLVAAGEGPDATDLGSTEIYDPATGSWTYAANVNIPRRRAVLALLTTTFRWQSAGFWRKQCWNFL